LSERHSIFTTSVEPCTCGFTHQQRPHYKPLQLDLTFVKLRRHVPFPHHNDSHPHHQAPVAPPQPKINSTVAQHQQFCQVRRATPRLTGPQEHQKHYQHWLYRHHVTQKLYSNSQPLSPSLFCQQ